MLCISERNRKKTIIFHQKKKPKETQIMNKSLYSVKNFENYFYTEVISGKKLFFAILENVNECAKDLLISQNIFGLNISESITEINTILKVLNLVYKRILSLKMHFSTENPQQMSANTIN